MNTYKEALDKLVKKKKRNQQYENYKKKLQDENLKLQEQRPNVTETNSKKGARMLPPT